MSIVTKTGDEGDTGVLRGPRVPKDSVRLEAYGSVDELNATIGMALTTEGVPGVVRDQLELITNWLFDIGCDLATPGLDTEDKSSVRMLPPERITSVETWVSQYEADLPPLRSFILPGGHPVAAALHVARTVCRRSERRVVSLKRNTGDGELGLIFLNRLSDLFFMMARAVNHHHGQPDVEWTKSLSPATPPSPDSASSKDGKSTP